MHPKGITVSAMRQQQPCHPLEAQRGRWRASVLRGIGRAKSTAPIFDDPRIELRLAASTDGAKSAPQDPNPFKTGIEDSDFEGFLAVAVFFHELVELAGGDAGFLGG